MVKGTSASRGTVAAEEEWTRQQFGISLVKELNTSLCDPCVVSCAALLGNLIESNTNPQHRPVRTVGGHRLDDIDDS